MSTLEDALNAEAAERSSFVRPLIRWLLIALGVAWIGGAMVTLARGSWLGIAWLALGALVLHRFVAWPALRRRRIRTSLAAGQGLVLEFTREEIRIQADGVGEFTRTWSELIRFTPTDEGVIFCFSDGTTNWLPSRVLGTPAERARFVSFLEDRNTDLGYSVRVDQ